MHRIRRKPFHRSDDPGQKRHERPLGHVMSELDDGKTVLDSIQGVMIPHLARHEGTCSA